MIHNTQEGNVENSALKALFRNNLNSLKEHFSKEVLELVESNIDFLMQHYIEWQRALPQVAKSLGVQANNLNNIPSLIEKDTFEKIRTKLLIERPKKIILGISGPGAVGKETIKKSLGFDSVVNTTTRERRIYESHGEHYNFINEIQFDEILSKGGFIINMERPGRGKYGIQKTDLEKILTKTNVAIIEENPLNLTSLRDYLKDKESSEFILIYVLPPSPVLPNLAARLADRCIKSSSDFRLAINNTLDLRQLDEFNSTAQSIQKGVNVLFIVNDSVERVTEKIKDLIK